MSMFHVKTCFLEVILINFSESLSNFFTEEIPAFLGSFTGDPPLPGRRTAAEHFNTSAAAPSTELDSYNILDMVNGLNAIDRENADASVAAQKELLALQNEMNSAASELAWERYKEYDSTKIQRYVEDMKAAGINPIIAFGSSGMPNITSASPSASSVSPWMAQKASAQGESSIGKYQQLVQGYIGMIASLLETGISTAGNVVSSVIGKGTPAPVRSGMSRNYYKGGYSEQYFYQ